MWRDITSLTSSWEPLTLFAVALALATTLHLVLSRREVSPTLGWMGLVWLVPLLGTALYWVFGINRIRRAAIALRRETLRYDESTEASEVARAATAPNQRRLMDVVEVVTRRPVLQGNDVRCLDDGDEAYPAMLEAIRGAEASVTFLTYIFDTSAWGRRFIDALAEAQQRGVEVRVLIDAAGSRYSLPPAHWLLKRRGVRVARFMPASRAFHINLRNHRKVMVVDGRLGFTGGMNIRAGHVLGDSPAHPVRDLHFEVTGPVVTQLQEIFAEDWHFTTGEELHGERWFPTLAHVGQAVSRCIADGPDEDYDKIRWTLLGAAGCAQRNLRIVTPYLLPDPAVASALNLAAMRGVTVDVVVPERTNLPVVTWAMWGEFWQILGRGVRVWLGPPPFDHTKLVLVDDYWAMIGSANIDPRSLRLNFELALECYDSALVQQLAARVDERVAAARRLTEEDYARRGLPRRFRDGVARLLSPYL